VTRQDNEVAAGAIVEDGAWLDRLLAVAAARPVPAAADPPAITAGQPVASARHRELPASANDWSPGADPGLVKVSVPEVRWLLYLATEPMTGAARDLGYAWSRWRRRH
jgi:hypothetical protein